MKNLVYQKNLIFLVYQKIFFGRPKKWEIGIPKKINWYTKETDQKYMDVAIMFDHVYLIEK